MQKLLCICLFFVCFSGLTIANTISDNFNDNSLNSVLWNAPVVMGDSVVSETGGQLRLTATSSGDDAIAMVIFKGSLVGDFDVQVDYQLFELPLVENEPNVMIIAGPTNFEDLLFVGRGVCDHWNKEHTVQLIEDRYTSGIQNEVEIPEDDTAGSLRLSRTGDVVSAYYMGSTDWVLIQQDTYNSDPIPLLGLAAIISVDGKTVSAAFDNFRLETAAVPEPASLILLGSGLGVIGLAVCRRKK